MLAGHGFYPDQKEEEDCDGHEYPNHLVPPEPLPTPAFQRRWWVLCKSHEWFRVYLGEVYGDSRWQRMMRMKKSSFLQLLSFLRDGLQKQNTRYRPCIPPDLQLSIILHRLGHGTSYFDLGEFFGCGETTVHEVLLEGVPLICRVLGPLYLAWPSPDECRRISLGFEAKCKLLNCHGAIDCSHIRIRAPPGQTLAEDYVNRKKWHSIVLQAVVDFQGCILDCFVGMPGVANDQRVLRNSGFFRRVSRGEILQTPQMELLTGFQVRPYILGDAGYTTTPWLMSPYRPRPGAPAHISVFNDALVQGRLILEQVFGRLKGRWRLLDLGTGLEWTPHVVHAACILHNFLLRNGDTLDHQEEYEQGNAELPNKHQHEAVGDYAESVREELAIDLCLRRG
ncbi:hypothetical protein R1sor_012827 [Riccia sorocarpa]|uniref:DDE Tnp4 domain-containing protein n=1 Tax=Riccia sorocarpa TaxID=122646 RepID=A0ABD3I5H9_9MARC